eukprot:scaffold8297_cov107-Skeletonema_dohrnii-CCMP3373.AAC.3
MGGIDMASWSRRRATPRKPAMVTAVATKENEEATVASSVAPSEAEGAVVHNHNNMASMILQASELATVEADGNADSTTLGDMEITLRAMKPSLVPTTPPSLHTDLHGDGSNVLQTLSRNDVDVDSSPAAVGVGPGELTTYESVKMLPSQRSPTSQLLLCKRVTPMLYWMMTISQFRQKNLYGTTTVIHSYQIQHL